MHLCKAFIILDWTFDLFHAYGFGKESFMLLLSYLSNRLQRNKINTPFSSSKELLQVVSQRSAIKFTRLYASLSNKYKGINSLATLSDGLTFNINSDSSNFK